MKKTLICSLLAVATLGFTSEIKDTTKNLVSGATIKDSKKMNDLPKDKDLNKDTMQKVNHQKQTQELVGSDPSTWTPAYLNVDGYKKCLGVQEYRGWEGLCMPKDQPKDCKDKSWSKLQEMNLVPCTKDAN